MDTLNEIISLLRVVIIPLGTVFRVVFCFTKMIYDEGPHYRLLVDITYLDVKYYTNKTSYKYIIDLKLEFTIFFVSAFKKCM